MGTATFVNPMRSTTRPARGRQNFLAGIDLVLVGVTVALTLFGVLMVYSAGPLFAAMANKPPETFLFRQMLWAGVGLAVMFVATFFSYRYFPRLIVPIMAVTLIALIVVVLFGQSTLGAVRSLFGASVRPSEMAKLATIIYVSVWLHAKRDVLNKINFGLIPLMVILGFMGGLIFLQPDFSAAFTVIILGVVLFFLADGEWRQMALILVVALVIGWVTVNFYPTGKQRVLDFTAGLQNPMNASFHVRRSLESIINGGLFGVGIGMGSTKFTGLPVPHTDSIFAVIAEETGLLGTSLLIVAYLLILWRGLAIARNAPDQLGRLLAAGVSLWIMIEALINMAVMVSLLPHAGNALPFISYGGSSLVSTLAGVGILLNVGRAAANKQQTDGGNTFGSVVDMRWRDGRRRVPRSGR
jgi:cell division protein FtsW